MIVKQYSSVLTVYSTDNDSTILIHNADLGAISRPPHVTHYTLVPAAHS